MNDVTNEIDVVCIVLTRFYVIALVQMRGADSKSFKLGLYY